MNSRSTCFVLFALLLTPFAWTQEKKDVRKDAKKAEFKLTADEQAIIDLTNAERLKAEKDGKPLKLKPLKMNPKLMEAARKHAENMAGQDKLDHILDEKNPRDRAKAAGYKSGFVGENIAWNQESPKDVLEAWMNSETHRDNILNKDYTEIGVAVAKNAKGEPYWVQVFGKP